MRFLSQTLFIPNISPSCCRGKDAFMAATTHMILFPHTLCTFYRLDHCPPSIFSFDIPTIIVAAARLNVLLHHTSSATNDSGTTGWELVSNVDQDLFEVGTHRAGPHLFMC
ncbi:hypothetical protein Fot_29339 [Forsythia ovata]|uniref:Uncharacterized protein n=1 Tax=Forsythia ovata TaxID=205694 RepID=A0ABD1TRL1_9LAMI